MEFKSTQLTLRRQLTPGDPSEFVVPKPSIETLVTAEKSNARSISVLTVNLFGLPCVGGNPESHRIAVNALFTIVILSWPKENTKSPEESSALVENLRNGGSVAVKV